MRYSLPTNEVSAQNQLAILRIYAQKSDQGKRSVRIDEIKALSPVKGDRISKCHRFLVDLGLLLKEGHSYRPSEEAIKISEGFANGNSIPAQEGLRALIARSWFGQFVEEFLGLVGSASRESLAERLLIAAKLPDVDLNKEKAGVLIDWLLAANFIQKGSNSGLILNNSPIAQEITAPETLHEAKVDIDNTASNDIKINLTLEISLGELSPELQSEVIGLIKRKLT